LKGCVNAKAGGRHNICGHNATAFADWAMAQRSLALSG